MFIINKINLTKFKQFLNILSGYIFGQGSMFFVQTYLMSLGNVTLIGNIGIGLGILSLLQWISDMGSIFLLPKYAEEGINNVISYFIARIIILPIIFILFYISLSFYDPSLIVKDILLWGYVIIFINSFSLVGLVDYYEKNHLVSKLSGLSWILSSCIVFVFIILDVNESIIGTYLGGAYSIGLLIFVCIQWYSLKSIINSFDIKSENFKLNNVMCKSYDIISYLIYFMSSQIYGRIVPMLIDKYIGVSVSGIYIYARNIINLFSQLVMFTRRVENKSLYTMAVDEFSLRKLINMQKFSLVLGFVLIISVSILKFILVIFDIQIINLNSTMNMLIWLSFIFQIFNFYSMFSQYYITIGWIKINALIQLFVIIISFILLIFLLPDFGLNAVFGVEILANFVRVIIYYMFLKFFEINGRVSH
jgi:hypothetical protein